MACNYEKEPKTAVEHAYCLHRLVLPIKKEDVKVAQKKSMVDKALNEMENKLNTDVVIVVDQTSFGCHGAVLRHFSERFAHCLPTGIAVRLSTEKITSQAFSLAYEWMLRKEMYCPRGKLLDLLQAAHYLYIPELVGNMFRCFSDRSLFSEADAINLYFEAKQKNKMGVAKLMISCVRRYFLLLVCTDEFREMDFDCLYELLSSDHLAVQSELEVFYAALYWLFADYENRKKYTEDLLLAVRFPLMTSRFVLHLAGRLHELVPRVADALKPLLQVAMLQHQQCRMGSVIQPDMEQRQRNWIMDPECPYHNGEQPHKNIVSPTDFLCYLDKLDNASKFLDRIQEKKLPYL